MIPVPSGARVWLATGVTDMRRGMNTLALQVQQGLGRDPHAGDLFIFRGRRGDLVKILWHDGLGTSLYAKRLERGRFPWPSASGEAVSISAAQLGTRTGDCHQRPNSTPSCDPIISINQQLTHTMPDLHPSTLELWLGLGNGQTNVPVARRFELDWRAKGSGHMFTRLVMLQGAC